MEKVTQLKELKNILEFSYTNDADELYHPKNIRIFDNSTMTGAEIANALSEIMPNLPMNLEYFHDEIKHVSKNCIFLVCKDLIEAARIANRSSLKMDYMNVIDNNVLMVFEKKSVQINGIEILTEIPRSQNINV